MAEKEVEPKVKDQPPEEPEVVFRVRQRPKPVTIEGEDGRRKKYTVREMSGDEQAWWLKAGSRRFRVDRNGKPLRQDYAGMHEDLICLCLYDEAGAKVPRSTVERFGVALKNQLFALCQSVNKMTAQAEEEEEGN